MNIAQEIATKLADAAKGWRGKTAELNEVRQDVERLEAQVEELQEVIKKAPISRALESRGDLP